MGLYYARHRDAEAGWYRLRGDCDGQAICKFRGALKNAYLMEIAWPVRMPVEMRERDPLEEMKFGPGTTQYYAAAWWPFVALPEGVLVGEVVRLETKAG